MSEYRCPFCDGFVSESDLTVGRHLTGCDRQISRANLYRGTKPIRRGGGARGLR